MKRPLLFVASIALAFAAGAVEVDAIAARVGEAVILKSDVVDEMRRVNAPASAYGEIRNALIERQLILKAAADAKMSMQDWVVENRLREIIQRAFGGDRNKLMDTLAKQRISYSEWHARMRDDMIVGAMRWQVVDKNVTATPAAMRKEYSEHPERYKAGRRATVSVILLKPDDIGKRDEVAGALKESSFGEVAKRYSADGHAANGGVWKDVDPAEVFRPEVCEELDRMPKGTISHWIDLDGWSFLLRKESDVSAQQRTFAEAYDDIDANVREAEAKRLYTEWMERLKASAYIKTY